MPPLSRHVKESGGSPDDSGVSGRQVHSLRRLSVAAVAALLLPAAVGGFGTRPGAPGTEALAASRAPAEPGKVRVDRVSEHSIALRWSDRAGNERRYLVRHRPAGAGEWTTERLPRNSTGFRNRGLDPGTVYEHEVRSCNRAGCSRPSPVRAQATLLGPFNGPHPDPECRILPPADELNRDVSGAPVHPASDQIIARINSQGGELLHPDFGSNPDYGLPFVVVPGDQPRVPIQFTLYGDESDPGPYPIPPHAPVEGGSDDHVIAVERPDAPGGECTLYELYEARYRDGGQNRWDAGSGAVFDLGSKLPQRPDHWTSADAAGLPIFPGLVRYEEVQAGAIDHAIRVTFDRTRQAFIHPATHFASDSCHPYDPPMGLRLRLKAGYDSSGITGQAGVVAEALKRYGMIVADNGANWFITGSTDPRWNDEDLNQLKEIPGAAFEVVAPSEPETTPCS